MAAERSRSCFLRPRSLLLAAVTAVLLVNGCSKKDAQPPPQQPYKTGAPAYYPQPYPQPSGEQGTEGGGGDGVTNKPPSLEEAALQLERFERELSVLLPSGGVIANPSPPPPAPGPRPVTPGPPDPRPTVKPPQVSQLSQGERCSLACRALGSMDRSASRICELAGDDDERCQSARDRVSKARAIVERACSACSS